VVQEFPAGQPNKEKSMKMKIGVLAAALFTSYSAFAGAISFDKLKCVADTGGSQRIDVAAKRTMGSAPDQKINYNGNTVAVGFFEGDQFEGQQVLNMELNGFQSKVYDPKKSLYILEAPNMVKIQCYIE
jgi:hypothetical protein